MATPVLMFMNMKGGVGKTTLAVEISRSIAYYYDKDVLLIDYDPQANSSFVFLEANTYFQLLDDGKSVAKCLLPDVKSTDPFSVVGTIPSQEVDVREYSAKIRGWYYPNDLTKKAASLHIIPGDLDLMRVALNVMAPESERRLLSRWSDLLDSAKRLYDCVVVDCHPAGSFFTKSALLASDAVIVPVTSDAYAATGLSMMRRHMEMWESSGGAKDFLIVFNDAHHAWDSDVESQIRTDKRFAEHCLPSRVRYSNLLRNLARRHQTAAEQPVAYRRRVGNNIFAVTDEIMHLLRERTILQKSW